MSSRAIGNLAGVSRVTALRVLEGNSSILLTSLMSVSDVLGLELSEIF